MKQFPGFINPSPDPADGRKVLLSATPAGRAAIAAITSAREVWLRRAVDLVVGPGELADLQRTIDLLSRLADDDTGSADRDRRQP